MIHRLFRELPKFGIQTDSSSRTVRAIRCQGAIFSEQNPPTTMEANGCDQDTHLSPVMGLAGHDDFATLEQRQQVVLLGDLCTMLRSSGTIADTDIDYMLSFTDFLLLTNRAANPHTSEPLARLASLLLASTTSTTHRHCYDRLLAGVALCAKRIRFVSASRFLSNLAKGGLAVCFHLARWTPQADDKPQDSKLAKAIARLFHALCRCRRSDVTDKWILSNARSLRGTIRQQLTSIDSVEAYLSLLHLYSIVATEPRTAEDDDKLVEKFTALIFQSKTPPDQQYVDAHAAALTHLATEEAFTTLLLPAMRVCLLRNPEGTIASVQAVLAASPTLSRSAESIGALYELLLQHAFSKVEQMRQGAAQACHQLALHIADSDLTIPLVNVTLSLLTGKSTSAISKPSTTADRIAVLNILADFAQSATFSRADAAANAVLSRLSKVMLQDNAESVVEASWLALTGWFRKAEVDNQSAVDIMALALQEALGAKSPVSRTTAVAVTALAIASPDDEESQARLLALMANEPLRKKLISQVNRTVAVPAQLAVVQEGLPASQLLILER